MSTVASLSPIDDTSLHGGHSSLIQRLSGGDKDLLFYPRCDHRCVLRVSTLVCVSVEDAKPLAAPEG